MHARHVQGIEAGIIYICSKAQTFNKIIEFNRICKVGFKFMVTMIKVDTTPVSKIMITTLLTICHILRTMSLENGVMDICIPKGRRDLLIGPC